MKLQTQRLIGALVLALASAVVLVGAAQGQSPDDRGGMLGVGGVDGSQGTIVPDWFERAAARTPANDDVVLPNDRGGTLGIGAIESSSQGAGPDWFERAALRESTVVHVDDRAGLRGPGMVSTAVPTPVPSVGTASDDAFQWVDAGLGAATAFGIFLLGALAVTIRHRSGVMRSTTLTVSVLVALAGLAVATGSSASTNSAATSPTEQIRALKQQVAAQKTEIRKLNATVKALQTKLVAQSPAGIAKQLAQAKAANDKYQSVDAAKADGYVADPVCISSPQGAMGIHHVKGPALADSVVDPTKPEILTYLPTPSGLVLLAAEYFKADADQDLSTDSDRPTLFGRAFDGPMLGHAPGMPKHYDLHVWLWKPNPSGMFAQWNPEVSC